MDVYVGIDFGTTNLKAGLFTDDGRQLRLERVPTPARQDGVGCIYDAAEIDAAVRRLLDSLLPTEGRVRGMVVTGMAEAGLMLDAVHREPLTPILPWFDRRTAQLAAAISPQEEQERFFRTGLRNSFKYGIYKYRWCLDHCNFAPGDTRWLSAVDYLVFLLTGEVATDPTFAARTYCYDLSTGDYEPAWLARYDLTAANFSPILPSGSYVGDCRLPGWEHVPVHIGAHDHICAAFGMGLKEQGGISNSCGTAETFVGVREARPLDRKDYENGYVFGPFPGEKQFWMANISASGLCVEWFRKKLQLQELDYGEVTRLLEPGEPTGILFLPALTGMGTPLFNPDFPGAFLGLRQEHDGAAMLRAVVEGVAYQGRMILEPLHLGHATLLSVGGATDSSGWMQHKADILGATVKTFRQKEATLTGAIALMCAQSLEPAAAEVFARGTQLGAVYLPDTARHQAYEPWYRQYCQWYKLFRTQLETR